MNELILVLLDFLNMLLLFSDCEQNMCRFRENTIVVYFLIEKA